MNRLAPLRVRGYTLCVLAAVSVSARARAALQRAGLCPTLGVMELLDVFEKVGLALLLGLLVGLQRERVQARLAGIRTFALITLLGAVCGLLSEELGGWLVGLGGLAVAALMAAGNLARRSTQESDPGITTEVAALLMFAVGAYLVVGHETVAIATGGATALLLHWKRPMHAFVARIGEADLAAIMQFVLITLVILPVLPDQSFGPYDVLNPRHIWLMVVLIVGISLGGYVAYKWLGAEGGAVLAAMLGGLISSTATTVSYARRTTSAPASVRLGALVLIIASTVALVRVIAEVGVVAPRRFVDVAGPLGAVWGWMVAVSLAAYLVVRGQKVELPAQENPAELKPALFFGALYAAVTLGVAAARDTLGTTALYGVAILSGLHDMDAITLSTAKLVNEGRLEATIGWRLILAAMLSNLGAKLVVVAMLGHRRLLGWTTLLFALAAAGAIGVLRFWPN